MSSSTSAATCSTFWAEPCPNASASGARRPPTARPVRNLYRRTAPPVEHPHKQSRILRPRRQEHRPGDAPGRVTQQKHDSYDVVEWADDGQELGDEVDRGQHPEHRYEQRHLRSPGHRRILTQPTGGRHTRRQEDRYLPEQTRRQSMGQHHHGHPTADPQDRRTPAPQDDFPSGHPRTLRPGKGQSSSMWARCRWPKLPGVSVHTGWRSKRLSRPGPFPGRVDGPACFSAGLLLSGGGSELVHALMGEADDGCYVTVG